MPKKVVLAVKGKKKRPGKRTRKANKGIVEWVSGNQDLTRTAIGRRVVNVARHGPLGIFKGGRKGGKMMGDMRNAVTSRSHGKISNIVGSSSGGKPYVTTIADRMERVGTVDSSKTFENVIQCALNPGLATCFPWLSTVAANYELYKFNKLWFEYRTTSGEVMSGSNPALGKVVMVTNYDVIQNPFSSIVEMENYEGNANFPPYQTIARHVVDVRGRNMGQVLPYTRRYIRSGPVPSETAEGGAADPHAYDIGLFQVGVGGMPAEGNQVGELWVGYSIDLIKPRPSLSSVGGGNFTCYNNTVDFKTDGTADWVFGVDGNKTAVDLDVELIQPATVRINNPNGRTFQILVANFVKQDLGLPNFSSYIGIDDVDGADYTSLYPGLTSETYTAGETTPATSGSMRAFHLTARPSSEFVVFTIVCSHVLTMLSPPLGIFDLTINTWRMPSPLTHRVFLPRQLVNKNELVELRKQLDELRVAVNRDEGKETFCVVTPGVSGASTGIGGAKRGLF